MIQFGGTVATIEIEFGNGFQYRFEIKGDVEFELVSFHQFIVHIRMTVIELL